MDPTTPDAIEPPANVLLVHASSGHPEACHDLRGLDRETAELRVSFADDSAIETRHGEHPAKLGLISVGDILRSASAGTGPDFSAPIAVDAIDDPTDLPAIGVSISRFCERWAERGDERITVCFRSLDKLLRYESPKTVFQFTHVLTKRLSSVDAHAHFHFDPTAHDDRAVSTFGSIFDHVVCDDSALNTLSEATDEDVAAILEAWDETDGGTNSAGGFDFESGIGSSTDDRPRSEATDEEIERTLGQL